MGWGWGESRDNSHKPKCDSPAHKTDTGSNMRWTWKMVIMETESVIGLREEKNVNFGWRDSLLGR